MDSWAVLAEVVSLLAVAFVLGLVAQRFRLDVVVGYLLAGVLLGPHALRVIQSTEFVQILAELGVALLLFTIGLEFSLKKLRSMGRLALGGGALQITLTILLVYPVAYLFGVRGAGAFVVGAAMALSSTAIVLRLLGERSELDSAQGRAALGILLFQDIAMVPLLILVEVLAEGKKGADAILQLSWALAKCAFLAVVLFLFLRHIFPRLFRDSSPQKLREVPVVLAMATCLASTWGAHALGLSPALGAFAGGVLLGDLPFAHQIRADVIPLRAVFVTVFFASIGMLAVPPQWSDVPMVALLTLLILVLNTIAAAAALRLFKMPAQMAVHTGILLSQIGEFSFVFLITAGARGILTSDVIASLVSASVLTLLLTPWLFKLAPKLASLFGTAPEHEALGMAPDERRVLVAGYGPAGGEVVRAIVERGFSPFILEMNPNTSGAGVHFGDASRPEILHDAGIGRALALVVTVPDPKVAVSIISEARSLAPDLPIIVRSRYHRYLADLVAAGATLVVDEEQSVGRLLAAQVLKAVHGPADVR